MTHLMLLRYLTNAVLATVVSLGIVSPLVLVLAAPQSNSVGDRHLARLPRFHNYPAGLVYKGQAAKLIVNDPEIKDYEDALQAEIKKGPNFAGHYAIVNHLNRAMGGVDTAAIVDLKTGQVYLPRPIYGYHDQRGAGEIYPKANGGLHYRVNSKLLIIIGQAGGIDGQRGIGRYYYTLENNQLKFLTFVLTPDKYR